MKSPLIIVCCLLMVCVFATAQEPCPQVIPALQQWKGGKGELALPAEGSIVLSPADEATLSPTAQILAQDLKELFGWNYVIFLVHADIFQENQFDSDHALFHPVKSRHGKINHFL